MKKVIFNSLLLICFFLVPNITMAQSGVSGTVTEAGTGEPLLGVSIVEKGTTTDFDGVYSISVENGSTLVISYIGYVTQELTVSGGTLNIRMESDVLQLKDVIVTANRVEENL